MASDTCPTGKSARIDLTYSRASLPVTPRDRPGDRLNGRLYSGWGAINVPGQKLKGWHFLGAAGDFIWMAGNSPPSLQLFSNFWLAWPPIGWFHDAANPPR